MGINLISYPVLPSGTLIADNIKYPGGSSDALQKLPTYNGSTVDAALAIVSTTGAVLLPQMTSAQINELNVGNACIVYNSDTELLNYSVAGIWYPLDSSFGPIVAPMITLNPGSAIDPTLNFSNDGTTGLFLPTPGTLGITTSGALNTEFTGTSSDVNYFRLQSALTGNSPILSVLGSDSNIGLSLKTKGTGTVNISGNGTNPGTVSFYNTANSFSVNLSASSSQSSNISFTLPTNIVAGNFLTTDSFGNWSWASSTAAEIFEDGSGDLFVGTTAGNRSATGISNNTIVGLSAAPSLGNSSSANTIFGHNALVSLIAPSSANNTAIGSASGASYTSYSNCTFIGAGTDAPFNSSINAISIGAGAIAPANNSMALGKNITSISTNTLGCSLGISALPFSSIYLGSTATNIQVLPATPSSSRIYTIPDAGSNGFFQIKVVVNVVATSVTMVAGSTYFPNNASLVTLTLPAVSSFGSTIQIIGMGAGGFSIAQNAGQSINFGTQSTTIGVGGSLNSTIQYQSVTLMCLVANTTWTVTNVTANLTVI